MLRKKRVLCQDRRRLFDIRLLIIKSCDGSIKFVKESDRFGKVIVKHLTDIPIFVECLSGKDQLSSLLFIVYVGLQFVV